MARDLLSLGFKALGQTLLLGHSPFCDCATCGELEGDAGRLAGLVRGAAAASHQVAPPRPERGAPVVVAEVVRPVPPAPKVIDAQVIEVRPAGSGEKPKAKRSRAKASKGAAAVRALGPGGRAPSPFGSKR